MKPSVAPTPTRREEPRPPPKAPEVDSRWANLKPLAGGSALASSSRPGGPGNRRPSAPQDVPAEEAVSFSGWISGAASHLQSFLGSADTTKKNDPANAGGSSRAGQQGGAAPSQPAARPASRVKIGLVLIAAFGGMGLFSWSGAVVKEPDEPDIFTAAQDQVASALPLSEVTDSVSKPAEDLTALMTDAKKTLERHEKMLRYIMDRFVERDDTGTGKSVEPEQAPPQKASNVGASSAGGAKGFGQASSVQEDQSNLPPAEAASSSNKRKRVGSVDGLEAPSSEETSESQEPQLSTVHRERDASASEDVPFKNPVYASGGSSPAVATGTSEKSGGATAETQLGYEGEASVPPLVADMVAPVAPEESVKQSSYVQNIQM